MGIEGTAIVYQKSKHIVVRKKIELAAEMVALSSVTNQRYPGDLEVYESQSRDLQARQR